jgi:hypothetical protein
METKTGFVKSKESIMVRRNYFCGMAIALYDYSRKERL